MSETWLGLRRGPMSLVSPSTLVVAFLSSDPLLRAYEFDLLKELNRKPPGLARAIVGEDIPAEVLSVQEEDGVVETPRASQMASEHAAVLDVVVGRLLAFHRCSEKGLNLTPPRRMA